MKGLIITLSFGFAAILWAMVGLPILAAENAYEAAKGKYGMRPMCEAAQRAEAAWMWAGSLGRAEYWKLVAETDCLSMKVRGQ